MNGTAMAVTAFLLLGGVSQAQDTTWQAQHPRREQVNQRLANQNKRIVAGEESGKLNAAQAEHLQAKDAQIRQQERADAAAHGGHITQGEQQQLNREENRNSGKIYREKHP
jgi:hypothetical protein